MTENRPPTYNKQVHSMFPFDIECTACALGHTRARHNNEIDREDRKGPKKYAIGMTGPEDLTQVKLIVVSDINGHYERLARHAMFDILEEKGERRKGLLNNYNAGAFLRMVLSAMFGLDTYTDVMYTNAIKCSPGKEKPKDCYMHTCSRLWLSKEMSVLNEHLPTVPILIAGNVAFKAMCLIHNRKDLLKIGLNDCRRSTDVMFGDHPAVFTDNPAKGAGAMPRIESSVATRKGYLHVTINQWLTALPPLSASATFRDDVVCLREFMKDYE